MRLYICFNLILLCVYAWLVRGHPQNFEDTNRFFKKIDFDAQHRGSINITGCIKELINCWEITKPDLICSDRAIFDSACAVMYAACDENSGFQELKFIEMFESYCN